MVADAFISCRVPANVKVRVQELATREGGTESGIIKQLLGTLLRDPPPAVKAGAAAPSILTNRNSRLYLRLTAADRRRLAERAAVRDIPPATYAAQLLRVHLHGAAPLPKAEYVALRQAVLELNAIGRNLNQMARSLNQDPRSGLPGRAELQAMMKVAGGLRDHFKALLAANERAWKEGHVEDAR